MRDLPVFHHRGAALAPAGDGIHIHHDEGSIAVIVSIDGSDRVRIYTNEIPPDERTMVPAMLASEFGRMANLTRPPVH